jgi:hypothetical protein
LKLHTRLVRAQILLPDLNEQCVYVQKRALPKTW